MKAKLAFGAASALAIVLSVHADEFSASGCNMHPCPMMADSSKMQDMHKGMDMGKTKSAGQEYATKGKVVAVKESGITVAHEPVPALKWPAMTMDFRTGSPDVASGVKPGDTVSFKFVERNGQYVVTHLDKSK
jgi:Cu/Ag efflux protein CusF